MKIKNKKHKLVLLIAVLFSSVATVSLSSEKKAPATVSELKKELKQMSPVAEALFARKIKVQPDGIKVDNDLIPKQSKNEYKIITARLTVYWAKGAGTDSDSKRLKSATGYTLKQGDSIAVDPRVIPYDKEVIIPNVGLVRAVDTGSAVKDRTASGGSLPVIDVFFVNKKDAELFANNAPKVVKVAVLN